MSFAQELKSEIAIANKDMDTAWKKSVVKAFNEVVMGTPVDTGIARKSWLMGDNNSGAVGTSQLNVLPFMVPKIGGSVLLYSNLVYIERLENGWSAQAPVGMVKVVVARWPNIVRSNDN